MDISSLTTFGQTVINGLAVGAVYSALAMALAVVYRGTRVVNFAQADIAMVVTFVFWFAMRGGLPWYVALMASLAAAVLMGLFIERLILRKLVGEPLFTVVMATIGLSTILQGLSGMVWGHDTYRLPDLFTGSFTFWGMSLLKTHLFSMIVASAMLVVLMVFLSRSRTGLAMRATSSDQDTAQLMGIRINSISALIWIIACLISVGAGLALAYSQFLSLATGGFILKIFPAIILGGLESLGGVFIGGLIIGLCVSFAGTYMGGLFGGASSEIVSYLLTFLILMIKPYGLFGARQIERV
ncbi:MAG: branched-chain amino acid ABC transporter permease [Pseudomonadota bacterium]